MKTGKFILFVIFCVTFFSASVFAQTTLVARGSTWKYLDNGSNQGAAWSSPAFDESSWASGNAQLGYGDGDEATIVGYGGNANAKFITTYFRKAFTVANPADFTSLNLGVLRDDGAVVYLKWHGSLPDEYADGRSRLSNFGFRSCQRRGRNYHFSANNRQSEFACCGNECFNRRDSSSKCNEQRH